MRGAGARYPRSYRAAGWGGRKGKVRVSLHTRRGLGAGAGGASQLWQLLREAEAWAHVAGLGVLSGRKPSARKKNTFFFFLTFLESMLGGSTNVLSGLSAVQWSVGWLMQEEGRPLLRCS